ncbi:SDR family oxidoreductase [Phenylobacterium sp. J426]|uniref:SDR family oxidoreductase n=1 Tax=Phenylobacterium sp. J426 TaxID=2898439 RepID=UPI00215199CA|nr:SDR family oxidoreductase [Phenylobacterium sp. J426]MCR5875726.1 SDR family oxidoreductase [Phenylobacterium sp. J426]
MSEPSNEHQGEHRQDAQRVADHEREIQDRIEAKEARSFEPDDEEPPQTGARAYPTPPLPRESLEKPGREGDLDLKPMWDAPYYKGSGKLAGMAAIVTGGDSGIGRAIAVLFAREGCDVAIAYLEEHEDAKITQQAVEKEGRKAILLPGDVSDPAYAQDAVAKTLEAFGKLDILVNNAAFQMHAKSIEDIEYDHFDRTLKTNLYGYFNMAKAAVPHLKAGGSILNCGSVTGIRGSQELLDYSMTKGGIHAFTRSLSGSLIKKGIRVNAVAPGPVWTPLNPADKPDKTPEFGKDTPIGRPAQPEEIAPAFVFLASPQTASYITGEILPVIGGY